MKVIVKSNELTFLLPFFLVQIFCSRVLFLSTQLIELDKEIVDRLGKMVNLAFKFLHIAVGDILVARLLLVALVEFLFELGL